MAHGRRPAVGFALAVVFALPGSAHVLDQLVEATRLQIDPGRVVIELDLTPGIEIGPAIFFGINTNRDGEISAIEGRAYAARVIDDLVLEIDGRRVDLELTSATYPTFDAMRAGTGTIQLRAAASIDAAPGTRRLRYRNNHRPDVGIYLVNALVPESPAVVLGPPRRDERQQRFDLDYDVRTTANGRNRVSGVLLFTGAMTIGGVAYLSRRQRRRRRPAARL